VPGSEAEAVGTEVLVQVKAVPRVGDDERVGFVAHLFPAFQAWPVLVEEGVDYLAPHDVVVAGHGRAYSWHHVDLRRVVRDQRFGSVNEFNAPFVGVAANTRVLAADVDVAGRQMVKQLDDRKVEQRLVLVERPEVLVRNPG
jgi:hypothetical protein